MATATYFPENISATINHGMGPKLKTRKHEEHECAVLVKDQSGIDAVFGLPKFKENHVNVNRQQSNHVAQVAQQTQNNKDAAEEHDTR